MKNIKLQKQGEGSWHQRYVPSVITPHDPAIATRIKSHIKAKFTSDDELLALLMGKHLHINTQVLCPGGKGILLSKENHVEKAIVKVGPYWWLYPYLEVIPLEWAAQN
jgi:hypothetical protein